MIKANELRQGNWVKVMGYDKQVWDIMIDGVNTLENECCPYDLLEPIVLSPDILEKCGIIDCEDFVGENTYIKIIGAEYFIICDHVKVSAKPIKYLHQLQNLYFSLCGEELSINL